MSLSKIHIMPRAPEELTDAAALLMAVAFHWNIDEWAKARQLFTEAEGKVEAAQTFFKKWLGGDQNDEP